MHVVHRFLSMTRTMKLNRQLREVENAIYALPTPLSRQVANITAREMELAARSNPPWMYGTPPEEQDNEWGTGTDIGIARVRSDNPQVRMRGIGMWLAVAYHESQASRATGSDELHRNVMRVVRQLKERIETIAPTSGSVAPVTRSNSTAVA
jgi:hypothetical protein